jgi:hypothetical protein
MILFLTSLYNDRRVGRIGEAQEELKIERPLGELRMRIIRTFSIFNSQFGV